MSFSKLFTLAVLCAFVLDSGFSHELRRLKGGGKGSASKVSKKARSYDYSPGETKKTNFDSGYGSADAGYSGKSASSSGKSASSSGKSASSSGKGVSSSVKSASSSGKGTSYKSQGASYSSPDTGYSRKGASYKSQGASYSSPDTGYSGKGASYKSQGASYNSPDTGYSSQGTSYKSHGASYSSPDTGYSSQGASYKSNGGYKSQGTSYSSQDTVYSSQSSETTGAHSSGNSGSTGLTEEEILDLVAPATTYPNLPGPCRGVVPDMLGEFRFFGFRLEGTPAADMLNLASWDEGMAKREIGGLEWVPWQDGPYYLLAINSPAGLVRRVCAFDAKDNRTSTCTGMDFRDESVTETLYVTETDMECRASSFSITTTKSFVPGTETAISNMFVDKVMGVRTQFDYPKTPEEIPLFAV